MSNYSDKENSVRVDFFKPSGKWYATEAMEWTGAYSRTTNMHSEFRYSLRQHLQGRMKGMQAVCLQPYHEHSHPISVIVE